MISDELIQTIDIANTLNGGVSEPKLTLTQFPEYRQIELRVPGISSDNLHVKINNNQLLVYYNFNIESRGRMLSVPRIVYNKQIPYFIDAKNISANYSEGVLIIQLPYNELANGFNKDIPIEK
jgi:HSP20 family molecular chaperone IbpA